MLDAPLHPYLLRPPTDVEERLGGMLIGYLQHLGGEGLTDATAEIGIACMLALYAEHRHLLDDRDALKRIYENACNIRDRALTPGLRTGDQFKRAVSAEFESGRMKR